MARFLVDESLPRAVTRTLAAAGHDVEDVRDVGLRGHSDDEVADHARASGRILISADLDFSNVLRFRPGTHPGIVVVRLPDVLAPDDIATRVEAVLHDETRLSRGTTIIEPNRVRSFELSDQTKTATLFRPVGRKELDLIEQSGSRAFPPRLPDQPIFYPVLDEEYAVQIARDWNTKHSDDGLGYVTRFRVKTDFLSQREVHTVGSSLHREYWIPAEELDVLNANLVGSIEVIAEFRRRVPSES